MSHSQREEVEIRTVEEALAWGDAWLKRAQDAELRLRYALATKQQRFEMMHSCPFPRGSERRFVQSVNLLYLSARGSADEEI